MAKGDVIGRLPCVVCGHECKVKEDVNGSPYWVCGDCGARVQVGRDPEAAAKVRAKMTKGAPAPAPAPGGPKPAPAKEARRDDWE